MKEYLTDEELNLLIEELEQQTLYAPRHMKEQILSQAFPKQTVQVLPQSGGGRERQKGASTIGLLSYRLKIIAGMAAALMMLVLLPIQGELQEAQRAEWEEAYREEEAPDDKEDAFRREEAPHREETDWNSILNGKMRRAGERLNLWIGRIDHMQIGSLFEK